MNESTLQPPHAASADPDLAEQARPGHGVPSQDPNPAAQVALAPEEAAREAKSVMTGGGMVGGAALGASIGVAVGGPVGVEPLLGVDLVGAQDGPDLVVENLGGGARQ